jgi:hypothetical protein
VVAQVAGIYREEAVAGLLIGHRWWFGENFLAECVRVGVIIVLRVADGTAR